jgi:aarF domain-containing kinase
MNAGVESRLASLMLDVNQLKSALAKSALESLSSGDAAARGALEQRLKGMLGNGTTDVIGALTNVPFLFNTLFIRRAVIPSANGHFSARALARYYAMLATGGICPKLSGSSEPPLGSHPHYPHQFKSPVKGKKKKGKDNVPDVELGGKVASVSSPDQESIPLLKTREKTKLFSHPQVLDIFVGRGPTSDLVDQQGRFGLGFMRMDPSGVQRSETSGSSAFGHSGLGGSTGFCDPSHNFSLAVTLNKMNAGDVTAEIVRFVMSELNLACPEQFASKGAMGVEMRVDSALISVADKDQRPERPTTV